MPTCGVPLAIEAPPSLSPEERDRQVRRVTWVGVAVNGALAVAKIVAGVLGRSQALVADGVHSLTDLISDFFVLWASRAGARAADGDHPYGHGRFETVAVIGLALLIGLTGAGIVWSAGSRLWQGAPSAPPAGFTLVVIAIALLGKEALFRYTRAMANRLGSSLLRANAWDHRGDALTSLVALLGVAGAQLGAPWLDAVAALGVGVMLVGLAFGMVRNGVAELVDTGLSDRESRPYEDSIRGCTGVLGLHQLRARRMGPQVVLDVHLTVAPRISVTEGNFVAEQVARALHAGHPELADITVHVDAELPDREAVSLELPDRGRLGAWLAPHLQAEGLNPEEVRSVWHYLNGRLELDLFLPGGCHVEAARLQTRLGRDWAPAFPGLKQEPVWRLWQRAVDAVTTQD